MSSHLRKQTGQRHLTYPYLGWSCLRLSIQGGGGQQRENRVFYKSRTISGNTYLLPWDAVMKPRCLDRADRWHSGVTMLPDKQRGFLLLIPSIWLPNSSAWWNLISHDRKELSAHRRGNAWLVPDKDISRDDFPVMRINELLMSTLLTVYLNWY